MDVSERSGWAGGDRVPSAAGRRAVARRLARWGSRWVVSGLVLATGCGHEPGSTLRAAGSTDGAASGRTGPPQAAADAASQAVGPFELVRYDKAGAKQWEVEGSQAGIEGEAVLLQDVVATSYSPERSATLWADHGAVDRASEDVRFEEHVVVRTSDGGTMTTDSLTWDADQEVVTTTDYVEMERDGVEATGTGGSGHPALQTVHLYEQPEVTIGETVIVCDGPLVVEWERHQATFRRNVRVTDRRGNVRADRAVVYFDGETREVSQIVATGNVEFEREKNRAYSERAVYTAAADQVVLTGRPRLILYPEEADDAPATAADPPAEELPVTAAAGDGPGAPTPAPPAEAPLPLAQEARSPDDEDRPGP